MSDGTQLDCGLDGKTIKALRSLTFKPLGKMVILRPETPDATSKGGLEIPEAAREKQAIGIVIGFAEAAQGYGLEIGARVFYTPYAPQAFKQHEETYLLLSFEDILAIEPQRKTSSPIPRR